MIYRDARRKALGLLFDVEPGQLTHIPIVVGEYDCKLDKHSEDRKERDASR